MPAPFRRRVAAFAIDVIAPLAVFFVARALAARASNVLGFIATVVGWIALCVFCMWQIDEQGATGQTLGKRLQGLRLVRDGEEPSPPGSVPVLLRAVVNVVALGVGPALALFDPRGRTLGDKIAGSVVVVTSAAP